MVPDIEFDGRILQMQSLTGSKEVNGISFADADARPAPVNGTLEWGVKNQLKKTSGLRQTLLEHDVRGEKSIAMAQAGICLFILVLYFGALYSSSLRSDILWAPAILSGLIVTSALLRRLVELIFDMRSNAHLGEY